MTDYLASIHPDIKRYFQILEPDFPDWLNDYINTPELLKQQYISTTCGTIYTDLFDSSFFYSNLDHSIGVALVIWHFTHDKKQTLSGLFHDIATPTFKHCVDFMNGDYLVQESTEDLTTQIIANSKQIMSLLKRDNITLEEVCDYHIYPIADNDTPNLSSDRLEYSLTQSLFTYRLSDFNTIEDTYHCVSIGKNENNIEELEFTDENLALNFVKATSKLSKLYRGYRSIYTAQFLADILKRLNNDGIITRSDLYNLGEKDIISIIQNSKYKNIFNKWKNAKELQTSTRKPKNDYSIKLDSKIRYINPLVNGRRISDINSTAKQLIADNLSFKTDKYAYIKDLAF